MAVNKNFYITQNSMISQISNGTLSAIDYASFVDSGKVITALENTDIANAYLSVLGNRIAFAIDMYRSYEGKYKELVRGNVDYGNTIETIMHTFYETQAPQWGAALPANGQSVDMYKIARPSVNARYYVETNSYDIMRTIERTELKKAFSSPAEMDAFIASVIGFITNSNERAREAGRIGMVAQGIYTAAQATAAKTSNTNATHYDLLGAFLAEVGADAGLTAASTVAECLNNERFVKFAVATIKKVGDRMKTPSKKFSPTGALDTWTPEDKRHLFINSALEGAMDTYIYTNNYRPDRSMLTNYIPVVAWQSEDAPFDIKATVSGQEKDVKNVIGFIADEWAIGEFVTLQEMETTPYNVAGRFWNYYYHGETRYCINPDANMVVFTIDTTSV